MKKLVLVFALLSLIGCVDGNYNYPDPYGNSGSGYGYPDNRDCSYYGNCPGYGNNRPYYPPPPRDYNRCGGNKRCGNDKCGGDKRCGGDSRGGVVGSIPPAPPPPKPEVSPSCPSGTVLDSRGCRVTDPSKRRPGGDGYSNPCPSGMWYSGGRCVGN